MKTSHKNSPLVRIYVESDLSLQGSIELLEGDFHYLIHVMRKQTGQELVVFNGRDGEWLGRIDAISKRSLTVELTLKLRGQGTQTDIWVVFAPPRGGRLETIIEKTTELGVSRLLPVLTKRSVVDKINLEKCHLQAKEAAEQCERLSVPDIAPLTSLDLLLAQWDPSRLLLVCDETGRGDMINSILHDSKGKPAALLIGPEGGFAEEELQKLSLAPFVRRVTMGPRILRVDTAAIAALVCWQACIGDWEEKPHLKAST